jgi:methylmalonyl-CoA mutase N-terminal domain/subunit
VESLTDQVEARALALLAKVEELGGAAAAIEARFFQDEIGRSAYEYQLSVERGSTVIVGVNKFSDGEDPPIIPTPNFSELERGQKERLAAVRASRDAAKLAIAMDAIKAAAPAYARPGAERVPLMPLIIDAVKARATVGEISDLLRDVWGEYRPV